MCQHSGNDVIEVSCNHCGKILFVGTKAEAKGLIIYCVDCPASK